MKKAWIWLLSLLLLLVLGLSLVVPRLAEGNTDTATTTLETNKGETELDWFS